MAPDSTALALARSAFRGGTAPSRADRVLDLASAACAVVAGILVLLIAGFLVVESLPALRDVGPWRFLRDDGWHPRSGAFGLLPIVAGTALTTLGAVAVAAPLGVGLALFNRFHAPPAAAAVLRGALGVLAGIPSVVYGLWGLVTLVPWLARLGGAGQGLLAAALVLALMILPTVAITADAALGGVPASLRQGAAALGLSRWTTAVRVCLPAARHAVAAGLLLAVARALGETMAVLMVAGNVAQWPDGPLASVRTLTGNIALELGYATSAHRASLFVSGLVLMVAVALLLVLVEGRRRRSVVSGSGAGARGSRFARRAPFRRGRAPAPAAAGAWPAGARGPQGARPAIGAGSGGGRDRIAAPLLWGAAALVVGLLGWILLDVARLGSARASWDFVLAAPTDAGRGGGIGPVLVSTAAIVGICLSAALPIGLGAALVLARRTSRPGRIAGAVRSSLDLLAAVPSIVFGLFGNAFFCHLLGMGFSILSGGLTLACMVLPVLVRTTEAALRGVPVELERGAAALGLRRVTALRALILPAAAPGLAAGVVVGLGRALAETAALIFTAGYVTRMPGSVLDSGRALSVHVYDLAMNVPGGDGAAYGAALVLVVVLLGLNGVAFATGRWWRRRLQA